MILGADHLGRLEAGQAGAGLIPEGDATVAVEDECRHRHLVDDPRRVPTEIGPIAGSLGLAGGDRLSEAGKNHARSPRSAGPLERDDAASPNETNPAPTPLLEGALPAT